MSEGAGQGRSGSEILAFRLGPITLGSVLMLLESEGLTGVLSHGERVSVTVNSGQIVGASCGPISGLGALRTLFFLTDLPMSFEPRAVDAKDPIVAVVRAIIDCARLQDDWARIAPLVLKPTIDIATAPGTIQTLLRRLDGARPVQRATVELGLSPALVVDPLLDLLDAGKLVESGPAAPLAPWPGLSALRGAQSAVAAGSTGARDAVDDEYERCLEEGRRRLREGDLDLAETAFLMALDLHPDDRIASQNLRRVRQLRER